MALQPGTPGTFGAKTMALVLFVIAAAIIWLAVISPLTVAYRQGERELQTLKTTLDRHTRMANEGGALARELATLRADGRLETLTLKPASDGRAAAELQERMEKLITSAGARLSSIQALPVQPHAGGRKIGLRLQFSAANSSLRKVLHSLEFDRPLTILDNVFIHSATAKSVGNTLPITVRLDVFMFQARKT